MEEKASQEELFEIHQLVQDIQSQISLLKQKLDDVGPIDEQATARQKAEEFGSEGGSHQGTVVEGVFDGQNMVGPDGKVYTVPANYASKSKLVEGDIMKLTIKKDGSFMYKQIGPVERVRHQATLVRDPENNTYRAVVRGGHSYRLLTASVTYYKGDANDHVIILIPSEMESTWAAVENVIKQGQMTEEKTEMYRNMDDEGIINGESLLEDGSEGMLPPEHGELPSEHGELPAESGELAGETEDFQDPDAYDDGSKPFVGV